MLKLVVALVGAAAVCAGCGETEPIGPDPDTTSSSSSGTGAGDQGGGGADGSGGAGGDGHGASNEGGSSPMPALGYENGSRLRARVFVGADGSRQFIGWNDTELGVDCAFQRTPGGTYRCLPTGAAFFSPSYFTDPGCSTPAVLATCDAAPVYAFENFGTACDPVYVVHDVGPALAMVYVQSGAQCLQTAPPTGLFAYADGGSVSSSTFASATIASE